MVLRMDLGTLLACAFGSYRAGAEHVEAAKAGKKEEI